MTPENIFIIGYCLGGFLTWVVCFVYMRRFKVDKQFRVLDNDEYQEVFK